ncbi:DNA-binding domain-containing protein [Rhizobium tumorigenes]|uniref:DNA-binding domain-containing protein n=1 Tax=Rhizobium tumorigenes TaxID=2041385 RepID=A0AAF1KWG8_9HYPH|nr:DNA-binding domain-containing protein [Rhizobium tumorigenes]WFR98621.1 DNA-binding domain-containing protein [Rhizobium tumorigenes]
MERADHMAPDGLTPDFGAMFSSPLVDPECPTPDGVIGPNGKAADKRYNVYRNNVTVSLIEALVSIYPAVQRLTGIEFFRAMARFHIRETPPSSPLLFEYGREFPDFIERYEYAQSLPWLADVARLERAWLDCYHAADAAPIAATAFGSIPADRLAEAVFVPHPAVRITCSRFSAISIFVANREEGHARLIDAGQAQDALITRPGHDVIVRHLPPGGVTFLTRLIAGDPLGSAVSAALEVASNFDLPANIAGMLDAGVFVSIKDGDLQWK